MSEKASIDWFRFGVRFFCGALLGLLLGFGFWVRSGDSGPSGWLIVLGTASVIGTIAGFCGDDFWHSLRDWLPWVP